MKRFMIALSLLTLVLIGARCDLCAEKGCEEEGVPPRSVMMEGR